MKGLQYQRMDERVAVSEDGWKGCSIRGWMKGLQYQRMDERVVISEDG